MDSPRSKNVLSLTKLLIPYDAKGGTRDKKVKEVSAMGLFTVK